MARLLRYPVCSQVKVYRDPLEVKANCDQEVTEQNMLIKLTASEYWSVSDWMVSVILIVLDRGIFMGRAMASDTLINCEALFFTPSLPGHTGLLSGETIKRITLSLIGSYIINLNLWRPCFILHWAMLTVLTRVEGSTEGLTFIKAILQAPKTWFRFITHWIRASFATAWYFRTMCSVIRENLGKVVLIVNVRHTYLLPI